MKEDIAKTDQEHLSAENALLEHIFSHLDKAIAVISPNLDILKTNLVFNNFFEPENETDLHLNLAHLPSGFWKETKASALLKDHYEDGQFDFDKELTWENTETGIRHIHIRSQSLNDDLSNGSSKILLLFTDVTVERENEKGRNQRIRFMMHELRNPLSNISLCIELLADSVKENNQEEADMFLSKAAKSVQRMKELINNLNEIRQPS